MTISIVIPVYNVQDYIKKCLDSILSQTFSDLEIILVDDGSTDLSGRICDYYSENDKRIKVIHTANGGQSEARNVGIKNATSEWITFIDSDDYVSSDYIEYLYNLIQVHNAESSNSFPETNLYLLKYSVRYIFPQTPISKPSFSNILRIAVFASIRATSPLPCLIIFLGVI